MKTLCTISFLIGSTLSAVAQLAPQRTAPLMDHMREVNAQWTIQDIALVNGDALVHFTDESERIAMHLHLVIADLSARATDGLTAAQRTQRAALLQELDTYADRGLFPLNTVLPYRNPVFLDPVGTACAVGQLMIESGDRALAERIQANMNLGFVHQILEDKDLHSPVADWAQYHGFTADELAWIQPGYPPQTFWGEMGNGTDSTVNALLVNAMGDLVVAGSFITAGGITVNGIGTWNGAYYNMIGNGLDGEVTTIIEHDGKLYAGGAFQGGLSDLAVWDGTVWSYQMVMMGMSPRINDLHIFNNALYACGESSGFAGIVHEVMVLQGGTWNYVDEPLNGPVLTLDDHDGKLVAGGEFDEIGQFGGTPCAHVAELVNGNWQQLADGLADPVYALHDRNGKLFAGGMIWDGQNSGFGLALLPSGAVQWTAPQYMNGSLLSTSSNGQDRVTGFGEYNGNLYVCGSFNVYGTGMSNDGTHVARFIEAGEDVGGIGVVSPGPVNAIAEYGGEIVIAGTFSSVNITLCSNIASSNLALGLIDRPAADAGFDVFPVPVKDQLTIALQEPLSGSATMTIMDAAGRTLFSLPWANSDRYTVDLSALSPGTYLVRIMDADRRRTRPFIKN